MTELYPKRTLHAEPFSAQKEVISRLLSDSASQPMNSIRNKKKPFKQNNGFSLSYNQKQVNNYHQIPRNDDYEYNPNFNFNSIPCYRQFSSASDLSSTSTPIILPSSNSSITSNDINNKFDPFKPLSLNKDSVKPDTVKSDQIQPSDFKVDLLNLKPDNEIDFGKIETFKPNQFKPKLGFKDDSINLLNSTTFKPNFFPESSNFNKFDTPAPISLSKGLRSKFDSEFNVNLPNFEDLNFDNLKIDFNSTSSIWNNNNTVWG